MNRPTEGGGNYSSITPEVMNDLVSNVKGAGSTLQTLVTGYKDRAAGMGVSTASFASLLELGAWATEQVPMLQRRLTLAEGMEAKGADGYSPVYIGEPMTLTSAEAEAKGKELAQKLLDNNNGDDSYVDDANDTMDELASVYGNDPEVLSAFYAQLGPQQTQSLLDLYQASGGTDTDYVRKVSETFAGAFKDSDPPQEFWEIRHAFTTENQGDHGPDPLSASRLGMLQYGDFPPDFVKDVVNANGLDKLNENPDNFDWRNHIGGNDLLGLPQDNRALIFGALKNNPEATRWAFDGKDVDSITKQIYAEGNFDVDLQQNFIDAMKAGSGVNDETAGNHSSEASEFAMKFIHASAQVDPVPDLSFTKDGLADIATSYAPEFVAGSYAANGDRDPSLTKPSDDFVLPEGIDPSFYLGPKDVYGFLHGFADQDENVDPPRDYSEPFDDAVSTLYHQSLVDAAKAKKINPDDDSWANTNLVFGSLAELEYQGQVDVRGGEDASDQATKDLISGILTKGVGLIPGGAEAGLVVKGGVMIFKFAAKKGISSWRDTDPETTRVALLNDEKVQAAFLKDYAYTSALQEAGYPGTDKIPADLLDHGKLKTPNTIANDPDLIEKYQDWVGSQEKGTDDDVKSLIETPGFGDGADDADNVLGIAHS